MTDFSLSTDYTHYVIGSGLAAYAFIERILHLDPKARILCLERGDSDVQTYQEQLVRLERRARPNRSRLADVNPDDRSWEETRATRSSSQLTVCAGACFVLGGRSNYWHGWCKQPAPWQMRGFSPSMLAAAENPEFWSNAERLLQTRSLDTMDEIVHEDMQSIVDERLTQAKIDIPSIIDLHPALFAQGDSSNNGFSRFSASDALLRLQASVRHSGAQCLDIQTQCEVSRMVVDTLNGHVISLQTNRGMVKIERQRASVVLCAGVGKFCI